jgi:hypothetical protein
LNTAELFIVLIVAGSRGKVLIKAIAILVFKVWQNVTGVLSSQKNVILIRALAENLPGASASACRIISFIWPILQASKWVLPGLLRYLPDGLIRVQHRH